MRKDLFSFLNELKTKKEDDDDEDDGLVSQMAMRFGLTTPKEFNFATAKRFVLLFVSFHYP